MGEIIILDQDHREVVRGSAADSIIKCTKTSAPDVYVGAISPKETEYLHEGDSTAFPKITRMRLHLFRTNNGNDPFSATVEITAVPPSPKMKTAALQPKKKKRAR
jgi:hypothetical protein